MCTSPITISNPHFESPVYQYYKGDLLTLDNRFVSQKSHIEVPCGKCPECRSRSYSALIQRSHIEALTSYVYFVTLTYDDDHIPSISFRDYDGNVVKLYYADHSHIQALFKRLRHCDFLKDRDFRFLSVTEYGSEKFRPHHHILVYIAKLDTDDETTKETLLSELSINIRKFYGKNIGTRKHPVYEPYFTYARKVVAGVVYCNFDCRLVVNKQQTMTSHSDEDAISRTTNYLISYLNKPNRYESTLLEYLDSLSFVLDKKTYRRLCSILKSNCKYSKHFGFGFDNGRKVVPSPQSFTVSSDMFCRHETASHLPSTWQEFADLYPLFSEEVDIFRKHVLNNPSIWKKYYNTSFVNFVADLSYVDYLKLRALHLYMPDSIRAFIKCVHFDTEFYYPDILPKRDFDSAYQSSVAYKTIRKFVREGIVQRVPYLTFISVYQGNLVYVPLCKYYRRYCTDFADISALYDSLHVNNFDEYTDKLRHDNDFAKYIYIQKNNEDKHSHVENPHYNLVKQKINSIFVPLINSILELNSINLFK